MKTTTSTEEVSSHAKEKAFREQKTAFSPCGGSEKPAMRVAKEFAKPLIRKKIARTNPTHHEHEAKWEIPVEKGLRIFPMMCTPLFALCS